MLGGSPKTKLRIPNMSPFSTAKINDKKTATPQCLLCLHYQVTWILVVQIYIEY